MIDPAEDLTRAVEATLFAAAEPLTITEIAAYVGADADEGRSARSGHAL